MGFHESLIDNTMNYVSHKGRICGIDPDFTRVEIVSTSACSECHARSICLPSDRKQEFVMAHTLSDEQFVPGEHVQIVLRRSLGNKAVLLAYMFPFLILLISLFGCYALTHNEILSVLVCIVCIGLYYAFMIKRSKQIDKQFVFYVKKIENI